MEDENYPKNFEESALMKFWKKWICIFLVFSPFWGFSEPRYYVTVSTIKARAMAMGGAFTAVSGELSALDGNPACFSLGESGQKGISLFLNPAWPFLAVKNWETFSKDWKWGYSLFRGGGVQWGRAQLGCLIGEECLTDSSRLLRSDPWAVGEEEYHQHSTLGLAFSLAPKVSLGVAGEWLLDEKAGIPLSIGYRYGIQLRVRPNFMIGMFYFDFPEACKEDRVLLERLGDETLNAGLAYSPVPWMLLAFDIRNVTEEGKIAIREPHVGLEMNPWKPLTFRAGYYRNRNLSNNAFSGGLGIRWTSKLRFEFSFVQEEKESPRAPWIFFTSLWRLDLFRKVFQEE